MKQYARLMARPGLLKLHQAVALLGLRGAGFMNAEDQRVSGEEHLLEWLAGQRPDGVIVDVGANVGLYSVAAKRLIPRSRVIALEPHPHTYSTLAEEGVRCGFEAMNLGCSSQDGEQVLYDRLAAGGSSHATLVPRVIETIHGNSSEEVPVRVTTLDRLAREHEIQRIDLLKIDTEGYELEVLKGASNLLREDRIDLVQFEVGPMLAMSGGGVHHFRELLPGFRLHRLLPNTLVPLDKYYPMYRDLPLHQNLLAVRDACGLEP